LIGGGLVSIVALAAWLILAVSAFASYRLGWRRNVQLALVWAGIFMAVTLAISLVTGQ
jgi:hypothetical protein